MTNISENYENFCRACFNPIKIGDSNISNLFHTKAGETSLSEMFTGCTSIKISPHDNLPQNICGVCATWIDLGDEFRKKCLDSDRKFKDILESSELESCPQSISQINMVKNLKSKSENYHTFISYTDKLENFEPTIENFEPANENYTECIIYTDRLQDIESEIKIETNKIESTSNNLQAPDTAIELEPKSEKTKDLLMNKKLKTCEFCEETFISRLVYVDHLNTSHADEAAYGCIYCEKKLYSYMELHDHLREHTDKASFLCPICGKNFLESCLLNNHIKRHQKCLSIQNKSRIENFEPTIENFEPAIENFEPANENYTECIIYTDRLQDIESEIKIETNKIESTSNNLQAPDTAVELEPKSTKNTLKLHLFKCEICEKPFKKIYAMDRHMKSEHNKTCLPYKCTHCIKRFTTQEQLDEHTSEHKRLLMNKKLKTCAICEETFISQVVYIDHVNTNHAGEAAYGCIYCEKKFYSYMELYDHMREHTDKASSLCPICGKVFLKNGLLSNHIKTHTDREQSKCDKCPLIFETRRGLTHHVRSRHSDKKPFKCDLCDKSFTRKCLIMRHMAVHGGTRHYLKKCQFCLKRTNHLTIHLRTHTGEKPYKCTYCGIAYAQSGDLNKHLRIHVGENTYKCNECTESFRYWRDLIDHQNQHLMNNQLNSSTNETNKKL